MLLIFSVLFALFCKIYCYESNDPRLILKKMSATIGDHVLLCQEQIGFDQNIINTFLEFWSDSTSLDVSNFGCIVMCVMGQLELVGPKGVLQKQNAAAFLSAKGSDEFTKQIIIELYDLCGNIVQFKQECNFGIDLAKCFRGGILMRGWAPDSLDPNADDENYDYTGTV